MNKQEMKDKAFDIRCSIIKSIANCGSGHLGGAMSIVELLTYLYYEEMNIDPKNPTKKDRDKFVCSKGHAGPALYSVLADLEYFPIEWLNTLNMGGTRLPSHCDMNKTPGIDFTTGSLGQGISAAVGLALAQKLNKFNSYTYVLIGDGESQEGQVWEAAETANQWELDNLIAFTDFNKQQLDGYVKDILNLNKLKERWESFGWFVQQIDGHDFNQIEGAIRNAKETKGMPSMIILDTIKSKGYIPGENILENHHIKLSISDGEKAIEELKRREGRI
ncbi:MAG: transketolase [Spirochaetales bacterium]|nr:transketolase [Spirochaetales bacterium]